MHDVKRILIIAGPNGAGKTTFAEEYLPREGNFPEFLNADLIAAGLSPFRPEAVALTAGRLMLARINQLVNNNTSFAFETTLSSRCYLRKIADWRSRGYGVDLVFLRLPDVDFAIHRVEHRTMLGGHFIPPEVIRRRFHRGLACLDLYVKAVDNWSIYDSAQFPPTQLDSGSNPTTGILMETPAPYVKSVTASKSTGAKLRTDIQNALQRAAEKAVKRAREAGFEPVISTGTRDPDGIASDIQIQGKPDSSS